MINEARQRNAEEVARGVAFACRVSAAVSIAFAASLFVVTIQTGAFPLNLILPSLCSFVATLLIHGVARWLRIVKLIDLLNSIGFYALCAFVVWLSATDFEVNPQQFTEYVSLIFRILIGYWLAARVFSIDAASPPLAHLQAAYASLINGIGKNISIGETVAFGIAMLLSLAINVPTPHLEVQCVLTGSAVLVMTSLLWFAQFASAAQPASDKPQQP